jgi:hypothetical protein
MTAFRRAVRALSGIGLGLALSLGLAACHLLPGTPATRSWVQLRPVGPSLLVVLLDPDSPSALAAFRETLIRTSRGHERVIVISTDSACEIAALNLALDGHAEQGRRLARQAAGRGPELRELATELAALERRTRQEPWTATGEQITLAGLSGLQYREFYTVFLPVYAQVGVPGAAELRARLDRDRHLRAAIGRLATLYQDEEVMSAIPVEL